MPSFRSDNSFSKKEKKIIKDSIEKKIIKENKINDIYPYSLINVGYCCGC